MKYYVMTYAICEQMGKTKYNSFVTIVTRNHPCAVLRELERINKGRLALMFYAEITKAEYDDSLSLF